MKESIIIKNFGPLKEVEIDDIKPLTVFIGKSAGGKSIIMKVIVLMRYIYKMVNIRSYLKNAKITRSPFKLRFNSLLHDGLKGMITAQTEIYYTVEINGNKYTLKYTNRGLQSDINIPDKDLIFFKEAYVSGMRSLIPIWASKAVSVKGENLGFFFHETFNDFNDATDVIKEQKLEYLNLKMKVRKSGNRPKLFTIESLQNDAVPIELRYASSGIRDISSIGCNCSLLRPRVLIQGRFPTFCIELSVQTGPAYKIHSGNQPEQIGKVCPYPYRRSRT